MALDSYPNGDVPGAGPMAHVRTYFKQSYVGLPTKPGSSKGKPARPAAEYVLQGKVDGWFSNIDGDPMVELVSWADSDIDIEKTRLEKTG